MSFIRTIPEAQSRGEVQTMYEKLKGDKSYLPNYAKVFCHRPKVMAAWSDLQEEIRKTIDFRRYELITLAAAQELNSSYCSLAHGGVLNRRFYSEEQLQDILRNADSAELSDKERVMMDLARQVVRDSSSTTEQDVDKLRQHGFNDEEVFDIVTAAAACCFFAKIPDALGAQPDSVFASYSEPLKQALVVGRPIEGAQG